MFVIYAIHNKNEIRSVFQGESKAMQENKRKTSARRVEEGSPYNQKREAPGSVVFIMVIFL